MILGIDVGGTKTLVAQFDEHGEIVDSQKFPTPADYEEFMNELSGIIKEILSQTPIEKIGMALPGPFDYEKNIVKKFGNLSWKEVAPFKELSDILNIPVYAENDANVAAIYEACNGASKNYKRSLYITLSTGIGSGFTIDGKIDPKLRGTEIGGYYFEINGQKVKWETFASGKAFYEKYGTKASEENRQEIWQEYAQNVAIGLGNVLADTEVDVVVFGGSVGAQLEKFKLPLIESLKNFSLKNVHIPDLVIASKRENSAIYGCYYLATHS